MDRDVANRWCDAWEAEAALRDLTRDSDYWEAGKLWIDAQCAANEATIQLGAPRPYFA